MSWPAPTKRTPSLCSSAQLVWSRILMARSSSGLFSSSTEGNACGQRARTGVALQRASCWRTKAGCRASACSTATGGGSCGEGGHRPGGGSQSGAGLGGAGWAKAPAVAGWPGAVVAPPAVQGWRQVGDRAWRGRAIGRPRCRKGAEGTVSPRWQRKMPRSRAPPRQTVVVSQSAVRPKAPGAASSQVRRLASGQTGRDPRRTRPAGGAGVMMGLGRARWRSESGGC